MIIVVKTGLVNVLDEAPNELLQRDKDSFCNDETRFEGWVYCSRWRILGFENFATVTIDMDSYELSDLGRKSMKMVWKVVFQYHEREETLNINSDDTGVEEGAEMSKMLNWRLFTDLA